MKSVFALAILLVFTLGCIDKDMPDGSVTTTIPIQERLRQDAYSKVGVACSEDAECLVPMKYAVLSHCPYGTACIEGICSVVCPMWSHDPNLSVSKSYPVSCIDDSECDCSQFISPWTKECRCHNNLCMAVVATKPSDTDF